MDLIDKIFNYISELLAESRLYRLRKKECISCGHWQLLLENERRERAKLIELLQPNRAPEVVPEITEYQVLPRAKSWIQKRYELEEQSRKEAREQVNNES